MSTLKKLLPLQRDQLHIIETAMYHAEQLHYFENLRYLSRLQRLLKDSTENDLIVSLFYAEDLAYQITELTDKLTDEEFQLYEKFFAPRRTTSHDLPRKTN